MRAGDWAEIAVRQGLAGPHPGRRAGHEECRERAMGVLLIPYVGETFEGATERTLASASPSTAGAGGQVPPRPLHLRGRQRRGRRGGTAPGGGAGRPGLRGVPARRGVGTASGANWTSTSPKRFPLRRRRRPRAAAGSAPPSEPAEGGESGTARDSAGVIALRRRRGVRHGDQGGADHMSQEDHPAPESPGVESAGRKTGGRS